MHNVFVNVRRCETSKSASVH